MKSLVLLFMLLCWGSMCQYKSS